MKFSIISNPYLYTLSFGISYRRKIVTDKFPYMPLISGHIIVGSYGVSFSIGGQS